jgi:predicted NACHT family NTPase
MAKRSLKASSAGIARAKRAFERREWTQEYLASAVGLQTRQSVWKFFSGRPIERHLFIDICFQLDLDWQEIADLPSWDAPDVQSIAQEDLSSANASLAITQERVEIEELQNWQWLQEKMSDRTQQRCSSLDTMFNGEKPLEQLYTDLSVLPTLTCHRWTEATELQHSHVLRLSSSQSSDSPSNTNQHHNSALDPQRRIQDLLVESPRLLIYGKPGSGKTTLLQSLALQHLTHEASSARVPFFIPLRRFTAELSRLPHESIESFLFQQCQETGLRLPAFQQILCEGRIIVLLDGLDELSQSDRDHLHSAVQTFAETYPNNRIVLTCRLGVPDICYRGFMSVELADLSNSQIQAFVQKWFAAFDSDRQDSTEIAQQFLEDLFQPHNYRLHDLAKTPLLLNVLCWVFREQQLFPKRRARLYHTALELLLFRWDRLRNIDREASSVSLELADYMTLLSKIAELRFEAGQYFFEKKDILSAIFDYLIQLPAVSSNYEALWLESEAILRTLTVNTGLLVEQAHEVYSFSHLALQEYLTARRIFAQTRTKLPSFTIDSSSSSYPELLPSLAQKLQRSRWKTQHPFYHLASHVFDSRWHDVILLTIDLLSNSELLLELLKQQIDRSVQSNVNLRAFLQWIDQKASTVSSSSHSMSAFRAFYYGCKQDFGFVLATKLDESLLTELPPSLVLEARLSQLLHNLDQFLESPEPQQAQCIFSMLNLTHPLLEPSIYVAFNQAREVFQAAAQQPNQLEQWCRTQGIVWAEQLRESLMQVYDVGCEWRFTSEQQHQLESYYWANVFLVDCLHRAHPLSSEFQTTLKTKLLSLRELRRADLKVLSSRAG